jgi:hypothetical protein
MFHQTDMSFLNMTLNDIKQTPCTNINPNDPCTSCDYKNNDIFDSICVGNDYQPDKTYYNKDFTKNLCTSLYTVSLIACGLYRRFVFQG